MAETNEDEIVRTMLGKIEKRYGDVPLVNQVLSERPDIFIPAIKFGTAVMEGRSQFDNKTRYLLAVAAATALGSVHCVDVQMEHAIKAGATKDELLETMLIGSYMSMTRSQSVAFRKYKERFKDA